MAVRFFNRSLICYLGICWILWVEPLSGKALKFQDSKAEKQWYSRQLRQFFVELDRSLLPVPDPGPEQDGDHKVFNLAEVISEKLSPKAKSDFQKALGQYRLKLKTPKSVATTGPISQERYQAYRELRDMTYSAFRVKRTPSRNPDLELGKSIYGKYCASCHGISGKGDGIFANNANKPMKPAPTNFINLNDTGVRNPFSFFNVILAGIDQTSMPAFEPVLDSHEMWSVSFYLLSQPLREASGEWQLRQKEFRDLDVKLDLEILAQFSDRDFVTWLSSYQGIDSRLLLDWIRNDATFRGAIPRKL